MLRYFWRSVYKGDGDDDGNDDDVDDDDDDNYERKNFIFPGGYISCIKFGEDDDDDDDDDNNNYGDFNEKDFGVNDEYNYKGPDDDGEQDQDI
ncbi:hypothetical protein ElyMa_006283400 [Elysia marginata]|uniref:Prostatic spermine-binding protein-like n=1 Tax=Elysia marginata TaxID=1093978 RepID=A0AAV4HDR9_9GAST|nr:hypothetical protein ElyMa_006283400 [Elysia marginata]